MQLEYWIWSRRDRLEGSILDVGVENPRRWLGEQYKTVGLSGCDIHGDLRSLPVEDNSIGAMIVTEVLEHCENPFDAVKEMYRVMKPGAIALVTSPFFWPYHGTQDYADYWRFTEDGWRLLFKNFTNVQTCAVRWTKEAEVFYDYMRRFECMGARHETEATTGYLCEVIR